MECTSSTTQIQQKQPEEEKNEDQKKKHSYLHTWACSILLVLIIIIIVGCLVIWVKVNPKRIHYTVENAAVRDFAISSSLNARTNVTEYRLRSTFFFTLFTYNPNHRVTLNCESIHMTVEYQGKVVAFGPVEPFVQGDMQYRSFNFTVSASNVTLLSSMVKDIRKNKKLLDSIEVDVKMNARASFMVSHWGTAQRKLKIVCLGVMAHFTESTMLEKAGCYMDL